jgi:hypothetical protein
MSKTYQCITAPQAQRHPVHVQTVPFPKSFSTSIELHPKGTNERLTLITRALLDHLYGTSDVQGLQRREKGEWMLTLENKVVRRSIFLRGEMKSIAGGDDRDISEQE